MSDNLLKSKSSLQPKTNLRIGISGPPGVGKSTFIEAFGMFLIERLGLSVAVLSIDPSSQISGGSILGDKTRMDRLSNHEKAFVRPSPSRCTLGGVAQDTAEALILCEGAGYDIVIVETVGVGQSEVTVSQTVDFLMLLVSPGGGDDLQGIKRGIMELADLLVVNKADGDLLAQAKRTKSDYAHAVKLLRSYNPLWPTRVMLSSTKDTSKDYMCDIWTEILDFEACMVKVDGIERRRGHQRQQWMWNQLNEELLMRIRKLPQLDRTINEIESLLQSNLMTPRIGAKQVIDHWFEIESSRKSNK
jgi:LAO/AO transport system kinase